MGAKTSTSAASRPLQFQRARQNRQNSAGPAWLVNSRVNHTVNGSVSQRSTLPRRGISFKQQGLSPRPTIQGHNGLGVEDIERLVANASTSPGCLLANRHSRCLARIYRSMTDPWTAQSFRNPEVTPDLRDAVMQTGFPTIPGLHMRL